MTGPIGVDLDNTIVSYDEVIAQAAGEMGLIGPEVLRSKKAIRDAIRKLNDGEILWQKLQAEIYGPRIAQARLIEGVADFFKECRKRRVGVYIISHKTEFANYDTTGTNLRTSAMNWLSQHGFFSPDDLGLNRDRVFWGSTRREKIQHIRSLQCSCFIDDLEETYMEEYFPANVTKILYDPRGLYRSRTGITIFSSWKNITSFLFPPDNG